MAGDIGVREEAVVIEPRPHTRRRGAAEVAGEGAGRVLHRYGNVAIVEAGPAGEAAPAGAGNVRRAAADMSLDPVAAMGLAAFRLRQSPEYIAAKNQRPHADAPWGGAPATVLPPDPPPEIRRRLDAPKFAGGTDFGAQAAFGSTSERMVGSVAVGIIIVSGPNDLMFSATEQEKVVAEVQNGLGWLSAQNEAANLTWTYDIHVVSVDVQPGTNEDKEALWRDPAMAALGYSPDWNGVVDYVNAIRANRNTDWAYVAYFTKYPLDHFAYANLGGPRMVMQYANDGWGPDNIDRIFAHETGHIFQAPDEYSTSTNPCECGGAWGHFDQPNDNCETCAPGGSVPCIMRQNSWALCHWTPWHFGYRWPNSRTINQIDSTSASPSAAVFNRKLYVLFRENVGVERLWSTSSSDGMTWPAAAPINNVDSTSAAPTACFFNGKLYAFWKANDGSAIYVSASSDGVTWPSGWKINDTVSTEAPVAACVFNDKLYVFWKSNGAANQIEYSASSDGVSWPPGTLINTTDTTPASPAACVFDGKLYLFWKANDASNRIYYSASADGTSWPDGRTINNRDSTSGAPSALVSNGRLWVFWNANDPGNAIYSSPSTDGTSWPDGRTINYGDTTTEALGVTVFNDNPYLFWQANHPDHRIHFSP